MNYQPGEDAPQWLQEHRGTRPYYANSPIMVETDRSEERPAYLADVAFNRHATNDGSHVSPYDEGVVYVGTAGLEVRLIQGVDEDSFKHVLSRTLRATTGIHPDEPEQETDWEEMMRGGLQSALETQVIVFEVIGASRALTHQLVRTRKAGFHQQSQRATWYGDRPNVRWPQSIMEASERSPWDPEWQGTEPVRRLWRRAQKAAWEAYQAACDAGISYQDARFILPEGTTSYITCEYTVREFINVFAYRGCSMFMWEMVAVMRQMREVLLAAHPFLEPYVKISCEKGPLCNLCKGSGWIFTDGVAAAPSEVRKILEQCKDPEGFWEHALKVDGRIEHCPECKGNGSRVRQCTFQGWESVEGQCDFPWAKQNNRVFLPNPKYRIGKAESK